MKPTSRPRKSSIGATFRLREAQDLLEEEIADTAIDRILSDERNGRNERKTLNLESSPLAFALASFARDDDAAGLMALWMAHPDIDPNPIGLCELPLLAAARHAGSETVNILLDMGADVFATDSWKMTALAWASTNTRSDSGSICQELVAAGSDPNSRDCRNMTPFLLACQKGNILAAQTLLGLGADPRATSGSGEDALDMAYHYANNYWPSYSSDDCLDIKPMIPWIASIFEHDDLTATAAIIDPSQAPAKTRSL